MTEAAFLDDLIVREGGFVNRKSDRGGPTNGGITAQTLGEWRRLGRPATVAEVKALKDDEKRAIYRRIYVEPFIAVPFEELRAQLIDHGVNSGVTASKRALQTVLRVPVDGVIGPRTLAALGTHDWRLVNNALVAERMRHYVAIVDDDPTQVEYLHGWARRAVRFIV